MKRKIYNNNVTQPYHPPRLPNGQQLRAPPQRPLRATPLHANRPRLTQNFIPLQSNRPRQQFHQNLPQHHLSKHKPTGKPPSPNDTRILNNQRIVKNPSMKNSALTKEPLKKIESDKKRVPIVVEEFLVTERPDSKRRKVITINSDDDSSKTETFHGNGEASSSNKQSSDIIVVAGVEEKADNRLIPKKYCEHLTNAIYRHYANNKQDQKLLDRKIFLRDGVQELIGKNFGEGLLHLTGSSMSGFGTKKSDADMALIFNPNMTEIGKKKSRTVIARLAGILRRQSYCSNVEMIFAKVPIVKFFDNISHCDVDINVNNIVGIKNSFLLRSISLVDPRIPALVIVVKAWAKSHGINSAFQGSLSSYCLVSMIIYFFQTGLSPPILPPLKPYVDNLEKINVNTELQKFVPKSFLKFDVRNKEDIGDIFVKFFQFWAKKFRQNKLFSVYLAQESIRTYNQPFLDTNAYVFVIEEPFQKDNIARAVRGQQWDEIKRKFNEICEQFKDIASFEDLFGESV